MQIEISERTAEAILKLNERYFYELYAQVCTHFTEEFEFKNAVDEIAYKIECNTHKRNTKGV